ncbi:hypothetical protein STRAU_1269 [Streptomyces aurantiacus JA 4570]|uniref:Uncharacterized protein n=1 Tax=Streptomyces aurantiacus JA 4570 TaxID=1286094 RepID=S3ZR65_9ACTN|nr:hypothetical protein STRAU_1269 [Streptomyces aurantiacus JA 4570]
MDTPCIANIVCVACFACIACTLSSFGSGLQSNVVRRL